MGDEGDLPEEDLADEENVSPSNKPGILTSFKRQIYCCSGALLLPFFGAIAEQGVFENYTNPEQGYELFFIAGEVVGFISGGIFISTYGRKLALIISNLSFLLIITVSIASFSDNQQLFLPILIGFLLRFSMIGFIFYVAEISGIRFRAFFLASYYTTFYSGKLLLNDKGSISISIGVAAVLAFISSLMSFFVPETPYYLASKGNRERAEDIFTWIRAGKRNILEYNLMLDKARKSTEAEEILALISSSTFLLFVILCFLLKICNFSACELYQSLRKNLYLSRADFDSIEDYKSYIHDAYVNVWTQNTLYMIVGSLVFICISFVIPRKIIYGLGVIFTILLVLPIVLEHGDKDFLNTLFPICHVISYGGREPLTLMLPVEIFPATIRNGGLMIVFIFEKVIQVFIFFTSEFSKQLYLVKRAGKSWIFFSYSVSLIGVPFLLIFMPETKGKSLFEIEKIGLPLRNTSESQNTDESTAE